MRLVEIPAREDPVLRRCRVDGVRNLLARVQTEGERLVGVRIVVEILRELVGGSSNKEIGEKLGIEASTIKMHISTMLQKTGYRSRLELAVKARDFGLAIND